MTRKEFEHNQSKENFDYALTCYAEKDNPYMLVGYDTLKNYAIKLLKEDNIGLALHILNAIFNSPVGSDWYAYDFTAGTTFTPKCLLSVDDVELWIGFSDK